MNPVTGTRLHNKVAIVTGAASGIGAAIATAMIAEGARVLLVDRDGARLTSVAGGLGEQARTLEVDVTDDAAASTIVASCVDSFGRLDVVVNSAGVLETGPAESVTRQTYDRLMGINVKAPFFIVQAAIPHLRPGSSVIFIASGNAALASPGGSIYATSKGALVSMTRGLTADLSAQGVRVNCISPGPVETPLLDAALADPDVTASIIRGVPAGRLGQSEEIASAAVFLASDEASFVYGANLAIDGGTTSVWSPAAPGKATEE
jgi:NAD(P)-dependent dehydrogenase (short-subunit alcohol dehydrogenase family)